jgi:hypothetical protein
MKQALTDAVRSALSAVVALYLANGQSVFDLGVDGWKTLAAAAITGALTVILRWVQPGGEYGMGSPKN